MRGEFSFKFDGGDASEHQIDFKLLGRSLVGIERIVSDTTFVIIEGRQPKQRERVPVELRLLSAEARCFDISGIIAAAPGILPFVHEAVVAYAADLVSKSVSAVLTRFGGRPREAERHLHDLIELTHRIQSDARASLDAERRHSLAHGEQLLAVIDRLHHAGKAAVAPIGPSCDALIIPAPRGGPPTVIDVAMADAVRAAESVEVGDMQ